LVPENNGSEPFQVLYSRRLAALHLFLMRGENDAVGDLTTGLESEILSASSCHTSAQGTEWQLIASGGYHGEAFVEAGVELAGYGLSRYLRNDQEVCLDAIAGWFVALVNPDVSTRYFSPLARILPNNGGLNKFLLRECVRM
jgi:hypothetical protein